MEWQPIETAPKADETIIGIMGFVACSMEWDFEEQQWITFNQMWETRCAKYPNIGR